MPDTSTRSPARIALLKPIVGSNGEPEETRCLSTARTLAERNSRPLCDSQPEVRLLALLPVAIALLLPAAADAQRTCVPKGAKTVRVDGKVHVYTLNLEVSACLGRAGKRYPLGRSEDFDPYGAWYVSPIRIRGALVAFAAQSWDHYGATEATIGVIDLRDGRNVHSFQRDGGGPYVCQGEPPDYTVTDLALAPSGSVAWIATIDQCRGTTQEVASLTRGSEDPALLDEGSAVIDDSLAYSGGLALWDRKTGFGDRREGRGAPLP